MKSKNLLLLLVATSSLGLSSCGHTHEFGTEYSKNDTQHWYECSCGEKSETADHNYTIPGEVTLAQTHTTDGTQIYKCVCGATTTVTIPKDGHTHAETWSKNEQEHWHECSCGDKKDVGAHEYTIPGEVTLEPTHFASGTQIYSCICGQETTITLSKVEHEYSTAWSTNDEEHWHECTCGDKKDVAAHEYTIPGEVITPSTCTTDGEQKYLCICGKETTIVLKAKGHVDENKDITCDVPGCGTRVLPPNNSYIDGAMANLIGSTISTSNKYYVVGKVVDLQDAKNGIFYVDDGTKPIFVRLPYMEGVQYSKAGVRVVEGDKVEIYGQLTKHTVQTTSIPVFTGTTTNLTILEHEHKFGDPTCTEPASCPCLATTGDPKGHQDTNNDNYCDSCSLNLLLVESKLVFNTLDGSTDKGVLDTTALTHTFENDEVKFVLSKGGASSIDTTKNAYIKFRSSNDITFESKTTKLIDTIVLTSTSPTYGQKLADAFNAVTGATATIEESVITVHFDTPVASVTARLSGTSRLSAASIYLLK